MKTVRWVFLSLIPFFVVGTGLSSAVELVVLPVKDSVAIYQNEMQRGYEIPLFKVSTEDRLLVIESRKNHYLVKDGDGRQGWIEKTQCVRVPTSKRINFDPIDIAALSTPVGPVYIEGRPNQIDDMIQIERSFKGELRSNSDREEMERKTRL